MSSASFFSRLIGSDKASAPKNATAMHAADKHATDKHAASIIPTAPTAPDAAGASDPASTIALLHREPVLDSKERITGYHYALASATPTRATATPAPTPTPTDSAPSPAARRRLDDTLLSRLGRDPEALPGQRPIALWLAPDSLYLPALDTLASRHGAQITVVLDGLPPGGDWAGLGERIAALRAHGVHIGLLLRHPERVSEMSTALHGLADSLHISIAAFDGFDLQSLMRTLAKDAQASALPSRALVACDIQSHDDFVFCLSIGFARFHGPFIRQQTPLAPSRSGINRAAALPILGMVRSDAEFPLIAEQLKREPTLSYKLLRYLNSPALGLQREVDSLTHALLILGREKFYRWMSLLLFHFEKTGYRERMLTEQALVRARTLELLAGLGHIPRAPEQLFLVGLFSLLDIALGQSLPELLAKAVVPEPVRAALLGQPGALANALRLVILTENSAHASPTAYAEALANCGLSASVLTPAADAALAWANEIVAAGEA
jgi:c-di-GMP phosphodiesterase